MDNESVVATVKLPFDPMNRAGDLLAQARGIAAVVGLAARYEDQMPEHSITNACWALQEILSEVEKITSARHPVRGASHG